MTTNKVCLGLSALAPKVAVNPPLSRRKPKGSKEYTRQIDARDPPDQRHSPVSAATASLARPHLARRIGDAIFNFQKKKLLRANGLSKIACLTRMCSASLNPTMELTSC